MNEIQEQTVSNWASGSLWLIVVFIGAFVLMGVIIWARTKNRKITPEQHRRTEEATRDLYREGSDDQPPRT